MLRQPSANSEVHNSQTDQHLHYQGLDILRGVAAATVVIFHFSSRIDLGGFFRHAYLAVDLFFCLSGFVIDKAYGQRLAARSMSFKRFFIVRAVRLLPLVVFGTVLAALIDIFRPGDFPAAQHLIDIATTAILGFFLLPTLWTTTLEKTTYPLNGPVWSLFFEFIANLCYVPLVRSRYSNALFALAAICSLITLIIYSTNSNDIHFGTHADTILLGFPRAFWSFFLGVLLAKVNIRVPAINRWFYAAILFCLLACPPLTGHVNVAFDLLFVSVLVPFIVLGAANCKGAQQKSAFSQWCGDVSYPLYMIHYPLVRGVSTISRQLEVSVLANFLIASAATAFFAFLSSIVFRLYDVPVRRWINRRISSAAMPPSHDLSIGAADALPVRTNETN